MYNAYAGQGFGLARTGGFDAIFQSFVPQSPLLTGLWLKRLFRVGSTSDHTQYSDITINLYDSSFNLIGTIGKLKKGYPLQYGNSPNVVGVDYGTVWYVTADDGLKYWIDIDQIQFVPDKPLPLNPGATYYVGMMPDTYGSSFNYAVGDNCDANGNYNGLGRYIFGRAYTAVKSGGSFTSVTPIGTNMNVCFITQRNVGRTAYTFIWQPGSTVYWKDPATTPDQFKFIKENFDQRI